MIEELNKITEEQFLKEYNIDDYERPSVTVDTLVFTVTNKVNEDIRKLDEKELKILLIKRNSHPFLGSWAFPGGFVQIDESLDDAVARMIREEANISNIYFEQLYTYGDIDRDPRTRVLSIAHMALIPSENLKPKIGRDIEDIKWFSIKKENIDCEEENESRWILNLTSEDKEIEISYEVTEKCIKRGVTELKEIIVNPQSLTEEKLAFDHYRILVDAMNRLKNKIEYTPIAFNLVGEYFTRAEIQSIYELILDRKFTRMEIWRKIKDMVLETDLISREKGHRPSKYYKFNPDWSPKF